MCDNLNATVVSRNQMSFLTGLAASLSPSSEHQLYEALPSSFCTWLIHLGLLWLAERHYCIAVFQSLLLAVFAAAIFAVFAACAPSVTA
jgi:hypothetical protein